MRFVFAFASVLASFLSLTTLALSPREASAAPNDYHVVLNGFSQEVHASDGYEGILGSGARTISWWYRSHQTAFPGRWGIIHWGWVWSITMRRLDDGILTISGGNAYIGWNGLRNSVQGVEFWK